MVPWLEARDGNVPATRDNGRARRETLLQLPGDVRRVTLRTDGAGYQESVIRACNDPGVRGEETRRFGTIGLICGAARSEQLMVAPDKPQRECAELPHVSSECRRSLPHHVIRHVATRRALPGSLGPGEGDLPAAHGRPAHAIRACMTDFPAPDALPIEKANGLKTMHAREGVAAARDRCGHGEEVHAGSASPSRDRGTLSGWLRTSPLPAMHPPLGYRRRNGGFCREVLKPQAKQSLTQLHVAHIVSVPVRLAVSFGAVRSSQRRGSAPVRSVCLHLLHPLERL